MAHILVVDDDGDLRALLKPPWSGTDTRSPSSTAAGR